MLDKGTKEEIEEKTKDLSDTLSQIGQAMYQNQPKTEEKAEGAEQGRGKEEKKDKKDEEKVEEGEVVN